MCEVFFSFSYFVLMRMIMAPDYFSIINSVINSLHVVFLCLYCLFYFYSYIKTYKNSQLEFFLKSADTIISDSSVFVYLLLSSLIFHLYIKKHIVRIYTVNYYVRRLACIPFKCLPSLFYTNNFLKKQQ